MAVLEKSDPLLFVSRTGETSSPYAKVLVFLSALWCIPTIMTLLGFSETQVLTPIILIGIVSLGLVVWRPVYLLFSLPFLALLSPTGGFIQFVGIKAVLSDWFMIFVACQMLLLRVFRPNRVFGMKKMNLARRHFIPLAVLFLVSFVFGLLLGNVIRSDSLYHLLCFALIYDCFARCAETESEWNAILLAWTLATCLGSLILIHAFLIGRPLIDFATDAAVIIDRRNVEYLFRASYYYAGFHFAAGISLVGLFLRMSFHTHSLRIKLATAMLIVPLVTTLLIMLNKTAIFASVASFVTVYAIANRRFGSLKVANFILYAGIAILVIVAFVFQYGSLIYVSTDELTDSFTSIGSFIIRTQVWLSALKELVEQPWYLFLGIGPNVIEAGNQELAELFKVANDTRGVEGALDSSWLTYFVELGIVSLFILIRLVIRVFRIFMSYLYEMSVDKIVNTSFLATFGGFVYILFSFITQSLGYAKISWLPFQLILIASAYGAFARRGASDRRSLVTG